MSDDTKITEEQLEKELRKYTHEVATEAARRAFEHKDKDLEEIRTRIYERRLRSAKRMEMLSICLGSAITASILGFIVLLNEGVAFLPDPIKWMIFGSIVAFLSVCWVASIIERFDKGFST